MVLLYLAAASIALIHDKRVAKRAAILEASLAT
jgi:hypothetical protein